MNLKHEKTKQTLLLLWYVLLWMHLQMNFNIKKLKCYDRLPIKMLDKCTCNGKFASKNQRP
jgi:hypothetical protein